MRLPAYAASVVLLGATSLALIRYGCAPMPDGWLDRIVAPGSTIGGAVAVLGTWLLGLGATALGGAVLARMAIEACRRRRNSRGARPAGRHCP